MKRYSDLPIVGIISPPRWFDPAPHEFINIYDGMVRVQQVPLALPQFDYRLESCASDLTLQSLHDACAILAAIGAKIVVQNGTPFAWSGVEDESEARSRAQALARQCGLPVMMNGLMLIDALRHLGSTSPALATTYYDDTWKHGWLKFVRSAGFNPTAIQNNVDQSLVPKDSDFADFAWTMSDELVTQSVEIIAKENPNTDVIVITGNGARTLGLIGELEKVAGCAVIASDTVNYWAVAKALKLPTPKSIYGALGN